MTARARRRVCAAALRAAAGFALMAGSACAVRAEPLDYVLTATHGFVHFELDHLGLSTRRGRFDSSSGEFTLDRAAQRGHGEIRIRLDRVNTGDAALDQALADALGARREPVARLALEAFEFVGEQVTGASGRLQLGERTAALALRAERFNCYLSPLLRKPVCGGDFEATLEPAAWGLRWPPQPGYGPVLRLRLQIEAARP